MYFLANVRIWQDWAMIVVINTDQSAFSQTTYAGTSRDPPWPTSGHLVSGTHNLPLRRPIRAYLQSGYSSLESWRDIVPGEKNPRVGGGGSDTGWRGKGAEDIRQDGKETKETRVRAPIEVSPRPVIISGNEIWPCWTYCALKCLSLWKQYLSTL